MKSLTAVCQTGASMPAMKPQSGRVTRPPQHRTNGENAEMRMYLSKLKDLVPFMPKNRKLSKLEIIQHVIDYICDLQTELESHPDIDSYDGARELLSTPNRHFAIDLNASSSSGTAEAEDEADDEAELEHDLELSNAERLAAEAAIQQLQQLQQLSSPAARQPLVDRNAPNTFLQTTTTTTTAAAATTASAAVTLSTTTTPAPQQQQQQQQTTTQMDTSEKEQSRRNC